jgi:hypothetical protein
LFVQDSVGLYEGKFKIPNYQNGHAYLTSHRVCYVDNQEPRKYSIAIDLKDVERPEFYAGFLKSSAKVTLFPKAPKHNTLAIRSPKPGYSTPSSSLGSTPPSRYATLGRAAAPSPAPVRDPNATWICPICSLSGLRNQSASCSCRQSSYRSSIKSTKWPILYSHARTSHKQPPVIFTTNVTDTYGCVSKSVSTLHVLKPSISQQLRNMRSETLELSRQTFATHRKRHQPTRIARPIPSNLYFGRYNSRECQTLFPCWW